LDFKHLQLYELIKEKSELSLAFTLWVVARMFCCVLLKKGGKNDGPKAGEAVLIFFIPRFDLHISLNFERIWCTICPLSKIVLFTFRFLLPLLGASPHFPSKLCYTLRSLQLIVQAGKWR
jgi:hypothetical protein